MSIIIKRLKVISLMISIIKAISNNFLLQTFSKKKGHSENIHLCYSLHIVYYLIKNSHVLGTIITGFK